MSDALLEVDGVTKRFGGFTALDGVSVDDPAGRALRPDRTQRLRQDDADQLHLRRAAPATRGSICFDGQDISRLPAYERTRRGIARSFQIPRPFKSMTVLENLLVPLDFAVVGHGLGDSERHRAR